MRPARARERRGEHGALLGVQLAERLDQGAGVQEVPDPREPSRPRARLSSPCIGRDAPSRVVHGQLDRDRPQPDGRSGGRVPRSGGRVRAPRLAERRLAAIAGHRRTQGRRPRAQHSAPCQQPAVSRSSLFVTGERPERSPYIAGRGPGPRHLRADSAHISILKRAKLQSDSDTKWPCPWTPLRSLVALWLRLTGSPHIQNAKTQSTIRSRRDARLGPAPRTTRWRVCHKLAKTAVLHGADHHHAHRGSIDY